MSFKLACGLVVFFSQILVAESFRADRLYTPVDGGEILVRDRSLMEVDRIEVDDIDTATGAVFNGGGNLVFIARRFETVHVIEIDHTGQVLRDYDTGGRTLLRGSYIDFDFSNNTYVFANDRRLTMLDGSLELLASSDEVFDRASGVAIAQDGTVYATDQGQAKLYRFDNSLRLIEELPFAGFVNTGIDFAADGILLVTIFGDGALDRFDLATSERVRILSDLGFGGISSVTVLADGGFVTSGFRSDAMLYNAEGLLLAADNGIGFGDSVAVMIPEPSAHIALWACLWLLSMVRRIDRCRSRWTR